MDPEKDVSVGVVKIAEVHQPACEPLQCVGVTAQVGGAGGCDLRTWFAADQPLALAFCCM